MRPNLFLKAFRLFYRLTMVIYLHVGFSRLLAKNDRYIDYRPGDFFLMLFFMAVFLFLGMPGVALLYYKSLIGIGVLQFCIVEVLFFFLPPTLTLLFLEGDILFRKIFRSSRR